MITRFTYLENVEFELTRHDAERCSHTGSCDEDVACTKKKRYVKKQLDRLSYEQMYNAVDCYVCFEPGREKPTRETLEDYVVWLAAGNIMEDIYDEQRRRCA